MVPILVGHVFTSKKRGGEGEKRDCFPHNERPTSLPVACCSRYLAQVFPDPGKEASATTGPGGSTYRSGETHHQPWTDLRQTKEVEVVRFL